jgi:uncharacterized phage infection (PIP) family protein YhgE
LYQLLINFLIVFSGNFPFEEWASTKHPLHFLDKAKRALAEAAKTLKERRNALQTVQNGIAEVNQATTNKKLELQRLFRESNKLQGNLDGAKEAFHKLEGQADKQLKHVQNVEALTKQYEDMAAVADEARSVAEGKNRTAQRMHRDAVAMLREHEEELRTVNAALHEIRREIFPRIKLMNAAFSNYGAMSILGQPMAVVSQMQSTLSMTSLKIPFFQIFLTDLIFLFEFNNNFLWFFVNQRFIFVMNNSLFFHLV